MLFPLEEKRHRVPLAFQELYVESNMKLETKREFRSHRTSRHKLKKKNQPQHSTEVESATLKHDNEGSEDVKGSNRTFLSPQEYFDQLLETRGYNIRLIQSIDSAYFNTPSELQIASYGRKMQVAVRKGDIKALNKLLKCGLSPNACNKFGESILFLACRRGNIEIVEALMEARAAVQVCDDHGRNLLHGACWAIIPPFELVKILLEYDSSMLFMMDTRGLTPLSYINIEDWGKWNAWLDENIDTFFPIDKATTYRESAVATMCPNMVPLPKKTPLIDLEMIEMLACGKITADEVLVMIEEKCSTGLVASSESDDGGFFDGDSSTEFGSDDESSIFGSVEGEIFD